MLRGEVQTEVEIQVNVKIGAWDEPEKKVNIENEYRGEQDGE
jgi:hypothetical protein